MDEKKSCRLHTRRLIAEAVFALFLLVGMSVALVHFRDRIPPRLVAWTLIALVAFGIGFSGVFFRLVTRVEFEGSGLTIRRLLLPQKRIEGSVIRDFSLTPFGAVKLYFRDDRKPEWLRLLYFRPADRRTIVEGIVAILADNLANLSEEQLDRLYTDPGRYDFTATEKHWHLFVFAALFWGFQTFVAAVCVALLLIFPPDGGVFSILEPWVFTVYLPASWAVIFLLDRLIPKRTFACRDGVITCRRKGKMLFTFRAGDVQRYWLNYKEFTWQLKQTPKKERTLPLMGFSRREKRDFRTKLENLLG